MQQSGEVLLKMYSCLRKSNSKVCWSGQIDLCGTTLLRKFTECRTPKDVCSRA